MSPKTLNTTTQHRSGGFNTPAIKIVLIIGLVASVLYLFLGAEDNLLDVRAARQRLAQAEAKVARLAAENDSLQRTLWRLENDPNYLEKIAREEYGLVKPGERVYRLPAPADSLSSPVPNHQYPTARTRHSANKTAQTPEN